MDTLGDATRDVPLPTRAPIADPIRRLGKGESVLVPSVPRNARKVVDRIKKEFPKRRYTTRREGDGTRVWRTA